MNEEKKKAKQIIVDVVQFFLFGVRLCRCVYSSFSLMHSNASLSVVYQQENKTKNQLTIFFYLLFFSLSCVFFSSIA